MPISSCFTDRKDFVKEHSKLIQEMEELVRILRENKFNSNSLEIDTSCANGEEKGYFLTSFANLKTQIQIASAGPGIFNIPRTRKFGGNKVNETDFLAVVYASRNNGLPLNKNIKLATYLMGKEDSKSPIYVRVAGFLTRGDKILLPGLGQDSSEMTLKEMIGYMESCEKVESNNKAQQIEKEPSETTTFYFGMR